MSAGSTAARRADQVTDPRIEARRADVARTRSRRRTIILVLALFVAGAGGGGFALVHSSVFGARHVIVKGAPILSRSTVIAAAGLRNAPPLIDLHPATIAARVERLPWIATAVVSISGPSSVSIRLTQRIPVAAIKDADRYAICDPTGRIVEVVAQKPRSVPLLKIVGRPGPPGSRLSAPERPLAEVAAAMPESLVPRTLGIAETTAGVVVSLRGGITAVVGDAGSLEQKFVSLATLLARHAFSAPVEIDLRVAASPLLIENPAGPPLVGSTGG
jgi:cell division protein FtsQ